MGQESVPARSTLLVRRLPLALLVVAVATIGACRGAPEPLTVSSSQITVVNRTTEDWTDVEVWVNRYYRAQLPRLAAGGRVDAPLRRFQGGFGRYFDPAREAVREVQVTATSAGGAPVRLAWPPR